MTDPTELTDAQIHAWTLVGLAGHIGETADELTPMLDKLPAEWDCLLILDIRKLRQIKRDLEVMAHAVDPTLAEKPK